RPRHWPRWVRHITAPWSAAQLARSIPRVQIPQVPSACWQRDIITLESYVMRSRHLVDPELLPLLEMFPSVPLDAASLPAMRETMKAMIPPALAEDRGVTLEEVCPPERMGIRSVPSSIGPPTKPMVPRGCWKSTAVATWSACRR